MEKKSVKQKISIYTYPFINYYSIIESFKYLILLDRISSKTETFTATLRYKWQINKRIINMDSNDDLNEIDIKNRMFYYFDDNQIEDFNLDNILIDEKLYQNISIYNISYNTLIDAKSLRIIFDKIDGFIWVLMELNI